MPRSILAVSGFLLILTGAVHARALTPSPPSPDPRTPLDDALVRAERLAAERGVPAGGDTIFFGGLDEATGLAEVGGVWDFELGPGDTDPAEGWRSIDVTTIPAYVRRVTAADFAGDPASGLITEGGSTGSLWFGGHEAEAVPGCWPGGMGYSNDWILRASKTFMYAGTGDVQIELDYFTDSETQFDYSYVYVVDDGGVRSDVLNQSVNGRPDDGRGWSGSVQEGDNLGTPSAPKQETMDVDAAFLPDGAAPFEVLIEFDSDPLYSDGIDLFAGFLNSVYGPVGVDDVHVTGVGLDDLSDFETGDDGWVLRAAPGIGAYQAIAHLSELDPVPAAEACACPIADHVMVAAVLDGSDFPHPKNQKERLVSPAAYVGDVSDVFTRTLVAFDVFADLPYYDGVGFRIAVHYYPWTCPLTQQAAWTVEPADVGGGYYTDDLLPTCGTVLNDLTSALPATGVDSLKVVFELRQSCDFFVPISCTGPQQTNTSPYWDNIRLALVEPSPTVSLLYQDIFPRSNSLLPDATADIHSFLDTTYDDGDPTNAALGDSAVILAGTAPDTEAYLNFRVWPGPETNLADPWFGLYGGAFTAVGPGPPPSFAKVRMDTAEVATGPVPGAFATYPWPFGSEQGTKIIPDGLLTPGTTVEYFFSTNLTPTPFDQAFAPDTTGGTTFELEILPGYLDVGGTNLAPCLLYVDASNAGAQDVIESLALANLLGQAFDVDGHTHNLWDRYDYLGASTPYAAPLAREAGGDNGMTGYQSFMYKTILYDTGTSQTEGLRNGDAALLTSFLTSEDLNRTSLQKGLWLSGDGIASILSRSDRPAANALLGVTCGTTLLCGTYRDTDCGAADSSLCVRLDASPGAAFGQSEPYSVRGNGCPTLRDLDVLGTAGGLGNLDYVDQDAGGSTTSYASVSNERFAPADPRNFGTVVDGFSVSALRSTPPGFSGEDCGMDSVAVLTRASDVLGFLNADINPGGTCEPPEVDAVPDATAPVVTRLHRTAPNPFGAATTVGYELSATTRVRVQIFDVGGRHVRTLVDRIERPGTYRVSWDGLDDREQKLHSGVYWVRMHTDAGYDSRSKLVLLR